MWNSFLRNGLGSTECLWWKINLDPKPQSRKGLCTKHKKIVKSNRKNTTEWKNRKEACITIAQDRI